MVTLIPLKKQKIQGIRCNNGEEAQFFTDLLTSQQQPQITIIKPLVAGLGGDSETVW